MSLTPAGKAVSLSVPRSHANGLMAALLGVYSVKCETLHHLASEAAGHGHVTAALIKHRAEFVEIETMTHELHRQLDDSCPVVVQGDPRLVSEIAHSALRSAVEGLSSACEPPSNLDIVEISRCHDTVGVALEVVRRLSKKSTA